MGHATLSAKELSALLARLEKAQQTVAEIREQLIQAMAARHRPPAPRRTVARRK
jgi:hypothetical protein